MARPSETAVQRHPHLADEVPKGWVRVDMHSHTLFSGDSTTTLEEVADAVVDAGIDVLCITDHNAIAGAQRLAAEFRGNNVCRVIVGEEVRTHTGEIIGLFLTERIPFGTDAMSTARAIREQGGIVYVPHPFDPMRRNLAESSLRELANENVIDAIETFNSKTSLQSLNAKASAFAAEFDIVKGAGSDAHVPLALGSAFVEIPDFDGPHDFLHHLRQAVVKGHHWDEARPWSPRIVPSYREDEFNGD